MLLKETQTPFEMFIFLRKVKASPSHREIVPTLGQPTGELAASRSELNTRSHAARFTHCPVLTLPWVRNCGVFSPGGEPEGEPAPPGSQPGPVLTYRAPGSQACLYGSACSVTALGRFDVQATPVPCVPPLSLPFSVPPAPQGTRNFFLFSVLVSARSPLSHPCRGVTV